VNTWFITGASSGLGRALAERVLANGHQVIATARTTTALQDLQAAHANTAMLLPLDVTDHDAIRTAVAAAEDRFGGIDVLVNNASIFPDQALPDVNEALWDRTLAINLKAPFFLTQRLGGAMKRRGRGVIVNLGDLAGIQSWSGYAAHSVSKAGLLQLTRVAARALAPEVRVNAIAPGTVLPPDDFPDEQVRQLAQRTPLQRIGSPDDVAAAVLYLVRADFVTGETLVLDGGRSLR
jgi:pteridine reductase